MTGASDLLSDSRVQHNQQDEQGFAIHLQFLQDGT